MKRFHMGTINFGLKSLCFLFLLGIIFYLPRGKLGGVSAILGGSSWIVPCFYFNWQLKLVIKKFNVQKMLKWFFIGEAVKLLLSCVLIVLALLFIDVDKFSFFVGYVLTVLIFSSGLLGRG